MTNKNTGLPRPTKRCVQLSDLKTDESKLQPRFGGLRENHVAALCDVLKRTKELDPMSVWEDPDTGELLVADGHHRLEAYRRMSPDAKVGVRVFRCDRRTALAIPMADNAKNRLPLEFDEKANFAWKLTVDGGRSKSEVATLCGISERTVANQWVAKKALEEADEDLPDTWKEARRMTQGKDQGQWSEEQRDAAMEAEVAKADERIGGELARLFRRWPEAGAEFVERCAGKNALSFMADHLGWVAVSGVSEEDVLKLGMRLGEEFTEDELDRITAVAKEGPQF